MAANPSASGRDRHDTAPGDEQEGRSDVASGVRSYAIGLVLAAALTLASFLVPATGLVWHPAVPVLLLVLAVAQMGVHLVFFLHITTGPDNINNVLALAFGTLIVALVICGSLWIMSHLNGNMMPGKMHLDPEMEMTMPSRTMSQP